MKIKFLIVLPIIFTLTFSNCVFHLTKIYSYQGEKKGIEKIDKKIPVEFIRIPEKMLRRNKNTHLTYYNTSRIENSFLSSRIFILDHTSRIKIIFRTDSVDDDFSPGLTTLWCLTLGAIPYKRNSHSKVIFTVVDKKTNTELHEYKYKAEDSLFLGWLSIPIFIFIIPLYKGIKKITTGKGAGYNERIIRQFSGDFLNDYKNNRYPMLAIHSVQKRAKAAFLIAPGKRSSKEFNKYEAILTDLIEVNMVKNGYGVVERKNLEPILKEQSLYESGLTKENSVRIGQLTGATKLVMGRILDFDKKNNIYTVTYIINIIDIESGTIEWKNYYIVSGKNMDEIFQKGSVNFTSDLRDAGYI